MKRIAYFGLMAAAVLSVASCKTSKEAYKQAYEKAVQNDVVKAAEKAPEAVPVAVTEDVAAVPVREEKVTVVTGENGLNAFSVVCGSYTLKTNADALRQRLIDDGYKAVVALNEAGKTYRVIVDSFATKEEAVAARSKFKARYPDNQDFQASWILYKR